MKELSDSMMRFTYDVFDGAIAVLQSHHGPGILGRMSRTTGGVVGLMVDGRLVIEVHRVTEGKSLRIEAEWLLNPATLEEW